MVWFIEMSPVIVLLRFLYPIFVYFSLIYTLSDRFPAINNLIQRINLRKRRDSLILGAVIGVCTILLLLYAFHWNSSPVKSLKRQDSSALCSTETLWGLSWVIGGPWRFPSRRTLSWSSFGTGANFGQHFLLNLYLAAGTDGRLVVGCSSANKRTKTKTTNKTR